MTFDIPWMTLKGQVHDSEKSPVASKRCPYLAISKGLQMVDKTFRKGYPKPIGFFTTADNLCKCFFLGLLNLWSNHKKVFARFPQSPKRPLYIVAVSLCTKPFGFNVLPTGGAAATIGPS